MSTASMAVDAAARAYRLGEFHRFEAEGAQFSVFGAGGRDLRGGPAQSES